MIRASTGALFSVPLAETSNEEAFEWLKRNHIRTLAATPHTDTIYTDVDMTQSVAIVVGTEQTGLTELWMNHSDLPVRIPMLGKIDSLNVATATTILLYEAARPGAKNYLTGTDLGIPSLERGKIELTNFSSKPFTLTPTQLSSRYKRVELEELVGLLLSLMNT